MKEDTLKQLHANRAFLDAVKGLREYYNELYNDGYVKAIMPALTKQYVYTGNGQLDYEDMRNKVEAFVKAHPVLKFKVNVVRTAWREMDVEVEAPDADTAYRMAIDKAGGLEFPNEHGARYEGGQPEVLL
jgi:mannose/fructose/N-acetylgalactosamine-specific phosphotransferase system component IID